MNVVELMDKLSEYPDDAQVHVGVLYEKPRKDKNGDLSGQSSRDISFKSYENDREVFIFGSVQ